MRILKKIVWVMSIVLTITAMFTGCARSESKPSQAPASPSASPVGTIDPNAKPTATPNPKITNTEGQVLDTEEPGVEGPVLSLSDNEMDVKVGEETYHFILGDNAKRILSIFNKDPQNLRIMEGTVVIVYYEDNNGEKTATSIEIVESN